MPFEGSMGNEMTCQVCGESWKIARAEKLNHIIVPIVACQNLPRTEQTAIGDGTTEVTSLQALVKHMFSSETATPEEYDEHKTVHRAAALYYKLVGPVPEDHGGS